MYAAKHHSEDVTGLKATFLSRYDSGTAGAGLARSGLLHPDSIAAKHSRGKDEPPWTHSGQVGQ